MWSTLRSGVLFLLIGLFSLVHLVAVDAEPTSLVNLLSTPSSVTNQSVNVITGDFIFSSVDYALTGPDPYVLGRSYSSSNKKLSNLGKGWSFHHGLKLQVYQPEGINFTKDAADQDFWDLLAQHDEEEALVDDEESEEELIDEVDDLDPELLAVEEAFLDGLFDGEEKAPPYAHRNPYTIATVEESGGGQLLYKGQGRAHCFKPIIKKTGWTNATGGVISGQNNIKNTWVHFDKKHDRWLVKDGDGSIRLYARKCNQRKHCHDEGRYNHHYRDYLLREVRKPSGNRVHYSYNKRYHLTGVKTYNRLKSKVLSWVAFHHKSGKAWKKSPSLPVVTSDGKSCAFQHQWLKGKKYAVKAVVKPLAPIEKISYSKNEKVRKIFQKDHFIENYYYGLDPAHPCRKSNIGKVVFQKSPAGLAGKSISTHRYWYEDGHTTVADAHGNKNHYFYNKHKRLTRIEKKDHAGHLLMAEEYRWGEDEDEGNLTVHTVFNEKNKPVFAKVYHYDDRHNVIKEEQYGSFSGSGNPLELKQGKPTGEKITHHSAYSNTSFNLKKSHTDLHGNKTYFCYKPHTNLLTASFACEGKAIRKRHFFHHNSAGIVIEEIVDDGTSTRKSNLTGVSQRKIRKIKPRQSRPHYGEPEIIEEWAYDPAAQAEVKLKTIVHAFDKRGLVISKKTYDQNGDFEAETIFGYDDKERLTYTKDPLGQEIFCRYDDFGKMVSQRGPRQDVETRFTYDVMGRLVRSEEQFGSTILATTFQYNDLGQKVASTDPQGNTTSYEYDALGRMTKITLPSVADEEGRLVVSSQSFAYHNMGLEVVNTDEFGRVTTRIMNSRGQPLKETFADNTTKSYRYDASGNLITEVATNGLVTNYRYDYQNRIIEVVQQLGSFHSIKTMRYDANNLLEEVSPTGEKINYEYDFAGRKIASTVSSPDGLLVKKTTFHYDASGRMKEERSLQEGGFLAKVYGYDALDRVISEEILDDKGVLYSVRYQSYDAAGNVSSSTTSVNGKLSTTTTTYDGHGVPIVISDALGNSATTSIDYFYPLTTGQHVIKKRMQDPLGTVTEEILNPQGNIAEVIRFDPFGKKIAHKKLYYDASGNNVKIIEFAISDASEKEIVTELAYGPMRRIESITLAAGTPEAKKTSLFYNILGQHASTLHPSGSWIETVYDEKGRVSRSSGTGFDYSFLYDAKDRVTEAKNELTGQATARSYNGLGQLTEETLETGLTMRYQYDTSCRLSGILLPDDSQIAYSYTPAHLAKVSRLSSDLQERYSYEIQSRDLSGFVQSVRLPNNSILSCQRDAASRLTSLTHTHLSQHLEAYDPVGNLLSVRSEDREGMLQESFTYDALSQLTSEPSHTYRYDSLHNRLQKDDNAYQVNSLHSLLSSGVATFTYDASGNRTVKETDGSKTFYHYDALDRLISVTTEQGSVTYSYDAFHRRIKSVSDAGASLYLYQQDNEIGCVDTSGSIRELRVLAEGLGAEIGASIAFELDSTPYVPVHDYRGNVALLTNMDNEPVEWYRYTAFGEETRYGEKTVNPWRFSSKRVDEETKLVYFGRRYYDPDIGKWLTQDPLGLKAGPNLYAYVCNAPLTHFDLYGLEAVAADVKKDERGFFRRCGDAISSAFSSVGSAMKRYMCSLTEAAWHHIIPLEFGGFKGTVSNFLRDQAGMSQRPRDGSQVKCIYENPNAESLKDPYKYKMIGNGMLTELAEFVETCTAQIIDEDRATFAKIYVIYGATHGFLSDLIEACMNKLCIPTHSSRIVTDLAISIHDECEAKGVRYEIHGIGHSQGGAIMYAGIQAVSKDIQSNTTLYLIGSATNGMKKCGLSNVHNYVSKMDWVPWIASPLGSLIGTLRGAIKYYGDFKHVPFSTHFFDSYDYKTAREAINDHINGENGVSR